jgi:uncharacterized membrane protein YciS (DUF1049 family)
MSTNIQIGDNINVTQITQLTKSITVLSAGFDDLAKAVDYANVFMKNLGSNIANCAPGIDKVSKSLGGLGGNVSGAIGDMGGSVGGALNEVGSGIGAIGGSLSGLGSGIGSIGGGVADFVSDITGTINGVTGSISGAGAAIGSIGSGIASIGNAFSDTAVGLTALAAALPLAGAAMTEMAASVSGILEYAAPLLVFVGILAVFSLLGPGLSSAGDGILNIGQGMSLMTESLIAVMAVLPLFIESLGSIQDNLVGIILFILLAVAVFLMATALETINEQLGIFNKHMAETVGMFTTDFVIAFGIFTVMCLLLSLTLGKVADGIDKVTAAIKKENTQLAIQNPLLAAKAILSNPIVGAITVGLAVAGALLVKSVLPGMAKGGVVNGPTVALVGEGRYPEAVVPLGGSPQFSEMKADIANAVIQGISYLSSKGKPDGDKEIVLNIDGSRFARAIIPELTREYKRKGVDMAFGG